MNRRSLSLLFAAVPLFAQHSVVDAHNCYPYEGKYADRIDRALSAGFPVSIEQDLALLNGRVVLSHNAQPIGGEPDLETYFFRRVEPIVKQALTKNDRASWPLIYLHFDFKDNSPELLAAAWKILGRYQPWLTTAVKPADPNAAASAAPLAVGPIMALTEDSDAQEAVFYTPIPVGGKLLVFGSAHTVAPPPNLTVQQRIDLAVSTAPELMLTEHPTAYRRWWNNSWFEVEKGGARQAADWTLQDAARLKSLVDHSHRMGFQIRFYCLDGFTPEQNQGWDANYNFGSLTAARRRWTAARDAGVDFIATDQPEELARAIRPSVFQTSPGTLLLGGGKDLEEAFRWLIRKADYGDIVVLRASGGDAYNAYIRGLAPVHSVQTLKIDSPELARDPATVETIRNASAVFIAGGDQGAYARLWKYSPVASAIDSVASKGAPVGGTSAGLAILGGLAFTARQDTITSADALANPFDPRITLENGFLTMPYLGGVIMDSHFSQRNRMGRLQVFLARALEAHMVSEARGIGIDEQTAVLVEAGGTATVAGIGSAYFLRSATPPEVCKPNTPLIFRGLQTLKLGPGQRFNLTTWTVVK
ncbi:MAG: Type 1 glutamine amidotransferase-like domain-containing protein [Acidobacteriota bacterium]|nr:Type 1 glutamine amidotransferase-like domain-containing protein [Acidobacteriota bacterium]